MNAPITLKLMNVFRVILPMPATTGANVRTTGTKRASTIVFAPCWSKKCSVRSMYSRLNSFESGGGTASDRSSGRW